MEDIMQIKINNNSLTPIYEQLRNQIVIKIASGEIMPGQLLPSTRKLGEELGVNFHTVNKAYAMLSRDGYISLDSRKGAFVKTESGEEFLPELQQKMLLVAAEAVLHGIDESEFTMLCAQSYYLAKGAEPKSVVETEVRVRIM